MVDVRICTAATVVSSQWLAAPLVAVAVSVSEWRRQTVPAGGGIVVEGGVVSLCPQPAPVCGREEVAGRRGREGGGAK